MKGFLVKRLYWFLGLNRSWITLLKKTKELKETLMRDVFSPRRAAASAIVWHLCKLQAVGFDFTNKNMTFSQFQKKNLLWRTNFCGIDFVKSIIFFSMKLYGLGHFLRHFGTWFPRGGGLGWNRTRAGTGGWGWPSRTCSQKLRCWYCWWFRNPKQPPGMYKTL